MEQASNNSEPEIRELSIEKNNTGLQGGEPGPCSSPTPKCPLDKHELDGLFKYRFDHADRDKLNVMLDGLYQDKQLMAQIAVALAIRSSIEVLLPLP